MTLYFDTRVNFIDGNAVSTVCAWHTNEPIFAVAHFHQDRGASVTIFDDTVSVRWLLILFIIMTPTDDNYVWHLFIRVNQCEISHTRCTVYHRQPY